MKILTGTLSGWLADWLGRLFFLLFLSGSLFSIIPPSSPPPSVPRKRFTEAIPGEAAILGVICIPASAHENYGKV